MSCAYSGRLPVIRGDAGTRPRARLGKYEFCSFATVGIPRAKMKTIQLGVKQRGAALLEALIGILIFSIGILGLVAMQAVAVKQMADAKYRSDASFLANQLIGKMWGNRANLAAYAYAGAGAPPAALASWVIDVQNTLPGSAAIANLPVIQVAGNQVTVSIFWQPPSAPVRNNYLSIAYING
jgi:type IV pilus assembly protein PilV